MGLDIALGVMILLGAIRGWFRGFLLQAVRIGGLVGSVYAAAPIRELAKPHVVPYLVSIRPDLLDRMLWWASAVTCYVLTVGFAGMAVRLHRRRPYGEPEPNRLDQLAGFVLASSKGAVVVAFLLAGLDKYALGWARKIPWADEQARTSQALAWNERYRPADRIWGAPPVQQFVAHVRQMGVSAASDPTGTEKIGTAPLQARAGSAPTPRLGLHGLPAMPDPTSADFVEEVDRALRQIESVSPRS